MSYIYFSKVACVVLVLAAISFVINLKVYKFSSLVYFASKKMPDASYIEDHEEDSYNHNIDSVTVIRAKPLWTKDVINKHDFKYIIKPRVQCSGLVLVICAVGGRKNHLQRQTIRETWGSYAGVNENKAALIFFLGSADQSKNGSDSEQSSIDAEAEQNGDILQEDYIDHYNNLSLKSVSLMKWVALNCHGSRFVLKADDDMYVNIPLLVKTLESKSRQHNGPFVLGYVFKNSRPIRDVTSKWYTPFSAYMEGLYPLYTSGTAYSMTTKASLLLYEASLRLPLFWLEDVYITGLCAKRTNVSIFHSELFSYSKREPRGCTFQSHISGHRYTPVEIERIHKELIDNSLVCERKSGYVNYTKHFRTIK